MRELLAERLLAQVMDWTPEDVARERPVLQALATFKYNEYQQFSPGLRFIESLALWLNQFALKEERDCAYQFVRSRLVFISQAEMSHLVSISFPDVIRPILIGESALRLGIPETFVTRISNSSTFKLLLRQSLFLGLSDGARIDLFRRNNRAISHEQILPTYDPSTEKAQDMLSKLAIELEARLGRKPPHMEAKFQMVFLLDDFSGSGLSYLRKEGDGSKYSGKIQKVFHRIFVEGSLRGLVDPGRLHICIVLYIATAQAITRLRKLTTELMQEMGHICQCTVLCVKLLPESVSLHEDSDKDFLDLLEKYFSKSIIDGNYRKGRHEKPYLGFDQCALPVILTHNTPNNSAPLLWFEEDGKPRGLFPRVSRHKEDS
jgi:hypothetical protein